MKILVLNNDVMERTVIQQVLQRNGHEIVPAENSDTAMQLLQEGELRFVIVDRSTTDMEEKKFIKRVEIFFLFLSDGFINSEEITGT